MNNILEGKKIRLNSFSKEDLPTVLKWHQDTTFMRFMDAIPAHPKAKDTLKKWLEESQSNDGNFLFAIRPRFGHTLLGFVELSGTLWNQQSTWLAIAIGDSNYQEKGFGTEAMELVLKFCFHELNLHRVQLTVFSYNKRAIAVYEKLGFQREGAFRESLRRDGQYYDMYLYGILHHEWEERQGGK